MNNLEKFNKYIGVQGVIALILTIGYVSAILMQIDLPELYVKLMTFTYGFYFAKNGVGIIDAIRGKSSK